MRVAGFDGYRDGWVGVVLHGGRFGAILCTPTMEEALPQLVDIERIAIDIPIHPPDAGPRAAETAAKRMLGRRSATIFLTPPRMVLEAATYAQARKVSTARFGRGVSAQAFALRHRILEVEPLAGSDDRFHEVHPELSFMAMNGGAPVEANKKTWEGQMRRRSLLSSQGIDLPDDLGAAGGVPPDDVLDAAAAAWSAHRIATGAAGHLPESAQGHDGGRLGSIWF